MRKVKNFLRYAQLLGILNPLKGTEPMKTNQILAALETLTVGMTTTVNGHVVTRWSLSRYEVGTWNRSTCAAKEAASAIAK